MKNGRVQRSDVPWWLVRGVAQFHAAPRNGSARDCARMLCQVLPVAGVIFGTQPTSWPTVGDGGVALWLSCVKHWGKAATMDARGREASLLSRGREHYGRVLVGTTDDHAWGLLHMFVSMAEAYQVQQAENAERAERLADYTRRPVPCGYEGYLFDGRA
jgi:hypothetical protein